MEAYFGLYNEMVILLAAFAFGFLAGRFFGVTKYQKKFDELSATVECLRKRVEALGEEPRDG